MSIAELTSDAPMVTDRLSTLNGPVVATEIAPNPVRESNASLTFELNRPTDIIIDLVGIDGTTYAVVVAESRFETGRHSLDVDCATLPRGVYLLRILDRHGNALASSRVVRQ
jgi:hypothetical protein